MQLAAPISALQAPGSVWQVNGSVWCAFNGSAGLAPASRGQHSRPPPSVAQRRHAPATSWRGLSARCEGRRSQCRDLASGPAAGSPGRGGRRVAGGKGPNDLGSLTPPCSTGSSSWNQLADCRWPSGSRAPHSGTPVCSPTDGTDSARIVPLGLGCCLPSTFVASPHQHRPCRGRPLACIPQ